MFLLDHWKKQFLGGTDSTQLVPYCNGFFLLKILYLNLSQIKFCWYFPVSSTHCKPKAVSSLELILACTCWQIIFFFKLLTKMMYKKNKEKHIHIGAWTKPFPILRLLTLKLCSYLFCLYFFGVVVTMNHGLNRANQQKIRFIEIWRNSINPSPKI